MATELIEIVNPTGARELKKAKRAPRNLSTLRACRVGLLDNNKPNADKFLAELGALLEKRYGTLELVAKRKTTRTAAEGLAELAERCDVLINAFAD